jgi:hypothetical protein
METTYFKASEGATRPTIREAIYGKLPKPARAKLRPLALDLARVLAFPIVLAPVDITVSAQHSGSKSAAPFLAKAKKKWAKNREVMKVIAGSEKHWRELDD